MPTQVAGMIWWYDDMIIWYEESIRTWNMFIRLVRRNYRCKLEFTWCSTLYCVSKYGRPLEHWNPLVHENMRIHHSHIVKGQNMYKPIQPLASQDGQLFFVFPAEHAPLFGFFTKYFSDWSTVRAPWQRTKTCRHQWKRPWRGGPRNWEVVNVVLSNLF